MKVLKPILISALTVPLAVFMLVVIGGLMFSAIELFVSGGHSIRRVSLPFAGLTYAYIAVLVSSVPTIALGLPASLVARKYGFLTKRVVIWFAPLLGALFLGIAGAVFFKNVDLEAFFWFMVIGGIGGLINGYAFLKACKELA